MTNVPYDIVIYDDNILEENEIFNQSILSSLLPDGFNLTHPYQVVITITDNDRKLQYITTINTRTLSHTHVL